MSHFFSVSTRSATTAPGRLEQRFGPRPRLGELLAVEDPEGAADEEQDHLVERPWDGKRRERATPSKRPRNPAVPNHDLDGAERATDESACPHAVNLVAVR